MLYEHFGKRLFDIIFAFAGLVCLAPLFFVVALLIRMDSPGPSFFLQERMGKNGHIFKLVKFRSMHNDPVKERQGFTPGEISRITRMGKFLRDTKIDELPQLINVLKGDMSFVGPRPEVPRYRHLYKGRFEEVLSLRPGITDFASIKYRDEEKRLSQSFDSESFYQEEILPDKLRLALEYKRIISLKTDVMLIFSTLARIFR